MGKEMTSITHDSSESDQILTGLTNAVNANLAFLLTKLGFNQMRGLNGILPHQVGGIS